MLVHVLVHVCERKHRYQLQGQAGHEPKEGGHAHQLGVPCAGTVTTSAAGCVYTVTGGSDPGSTPKTALSPSSAASAVGAYGTAYTTLATAFASVFVLVCGRLSFL